MAVVRCPALALSPLLALAFLLAACDPERPARVVLVTLDTLRYDALAGHDDVAPAMPNLLARARNGARFERFYAATSVTQPSHASMLTALQPWEHGLTRNGQVLEARFRTVAEVLHDAGFRTGAVVASFPLAARFGFSQGFDHFSDDFTEHPVADRRWEGHAVPGDRFYSLADTVTDRALDTLDRLDAEGDGGELLWVHYFDPHEPYGDTGDGPRYSPRRVLHAVEAGRDPQPLLRRFRDAYATDVRFLDAQLERLLARLDADAARFETHVVIAADHGESFGEGGAVAHGLRLTPEQIRVPLVILSPRAEPGVRSDVAGSIDVAATLLSLAGVEAPGEPWSRGRDLVAPPPRSGPALRAFGMRRTFGGRAVTELRTDGTQHPLPELRFYAVDAEGRAFLGGPDGVDERPDGATEVEAGRVAERFAAFARAVAAGGAPSELDPETERALRALGYLQ